MLQQSNSCRCLQIVGPTDQGDLVQTLAMKKLGKEEVPSKPTYSCLHSHSKSLTRAPTHHPARTRLSYGTQIEKVHAAAMAVAAQN